MVLLLVWLIFGILAVELFGGKFYSCTPSTLDFSMAPGRNDAEKCVAAGGAWTNAPESFDNIFLSMRSLFICGTLNGWVSIMLNACDVTEVDQSPKRNASEYNALFFLVFIMIGSFFLVSLLLAVIFDNFIKLQDEVLGIGMLTDQQKAWIHLQLNIIRIKPRLLPLPPSLRQMKSKNNQPKRITFIPGLFNRTKRRREDKGPLTTLFFKM
ncbi:hypothetical protein RFI_05730 [Reticulomyxa filosa]|uniref:Ion transport domain-containing protein n=1 Tax=Reticulomyxa filosa TaxID=46433 RepID=X6NZM3_RETFI|nr:hypothetical protein RFI_05730 [Reticulomyxa filosa]|eukprot:ETO31391.1 hypothetical protein RFI_05730 [Reticulomyxa filosa]